MLKKCSLSQFWQTRSGEIKEKKVQSSDTNKFLDDDLIRLEILYHKSKKAIIFHDVRGTFSSVSLHSLPYISSSVQGSSPTHRYLLLTKLPLNLLTADYGGYEDLLTQSQVYTRWQGQWCDTHWPKCRVVMLFLRV